MKKQHLRWFTLIETIIAMAIIWVVVLAVFRSYIYMMNVNRQLSEDLNFNNFNLYVSSLFVTAKSPNFPIWTPFYLYFTWSNFVDTTADSKYSSWWLDFFSDESEESTHSIIKSWTWILNWVQYDFYEINASDSNRNNEKNYVIR
ncbi:MAG: hypothetical protein ACD_3C00196G0026 [uncultured bacterium (gcode 4)]|uniref:Uncharacterized protein n=1 Tax=uncultured bacterium (gcode 4) TaxID=1234023 RepID=K2FX58_9BACT|nr:MAG: hypothetical protein ACD_3C00196G0026 [uncultured bacterium (gcode 4)]